MPNHETRYTLDAMCSKDAVYTDVMKLLLFAVLAVGATLSSCQTYGNRSIDDPRKFLNLQEGKSTKKDIYGIFSQPQDVNYSTDGSRSMWTYFKIESSPNGWSYVPYLGLIAGGTNEEITKVYFFFDSRDTLIRMLTNKKSDSEYGLAGIARIASQGNRDDRAAHVSAEMAKIGKPFDAKAAHNVKFVKEEE
jgi:hypothetical protein